MRFLCTMLLIVVIIMSTLNCKAASSKAETAAGDAIKKLLQEKINVKFKEAANDVKTILVKHLGASVNMEHKKMREKEIAKKVKAAAKKLGGKKVPTFTKSLLGIPSTALIPKMSETKTSNCDEECRTKKISHPSKCHTCKTHTLFTEHKGASIHQNKAGRQRKNGGPQGAFAPPKPAVPQQQQQQQQQMGAYGMPLPGQPGQPQQPQQPQPHPASAQCGGSCPPSCAPTCDNNCCQMAVQQGSDACPPSCSVSCFPYCPQQCCPYKKDKISKTVEEGEVEE